MLTRWTTPSMGCRRGGQTQGVLPSASLPPAPLRCCKSKATQTARPEIGWRGPVRQGYSAGRSRVGSGRVTGLARRGPTAHRGTAPPVAARTPRPRSAVQARRAGGEERARAPTVRLIRSHRGLTQTQTSDAHTSYGFKAVELPPSHRAPRGFAEIAGTQFKISKIFYISLYTALYTPGFQIP